MSLLHLGHSTFSPHRETTPPHDLSLRSRKAELQNNRHLLATWEEALDHLEATPVPHNTTERAKRTEGIHILKAEIRRAQHRINTLTAPTSHIQ